MFIFQGIQWYSIEDIYPIIIDDIIYPLVMTNIAIEHGDL
jgi:hypothetical protein